ncbi:MAG: hypothetical protein IH851_09260 [Armatimonadetes bacterium]|nr:hypothetical protein [Armatimonadota bacterium]
MGKRIEVGWVASRPEGMIYENLLRSLGVPVVAELGTAWSGFADSGACRIYIDEDELTAERINIIEEVLGDMADKEQLERQREQAKERIGTEFTLGTEPDAEPKEIALAWFDDREEGELYEKLLKGQRVPVTLRPAPEDAGAGEERFGLFIAEDDLSKESIYPIEAYLGDSLDKDALAAVRKHAT